MSELGFIHRFVGGAGSPKGQTFLLLHGTGGDENDLLGLGQTLDSTAALLSPRGRVLERGSARFFRRLAEGVFDEDDVRARAGELAKFVSDAAREYQIDLKELVAVGYSNGANIAAAMILLGLAPFPKAILMRPMVPLSNIDLLDLSSTRVLLLGGRFDPIAQPPIVQELANLFVRAGADVKLELQDSGHELSTADVSAAQDWLAATN